MKQSSYSKILFFLYKLCVAIFILGQISCTIKGAFGNYHESEVAALLTWKSSMKNDSQVNLSSWVSENHICNSWSGIICNEGGRVSSLNLRDYGIRGTLHDLNITCFTEIMSIDFSYNFLFGMVPTKLSNLSRLTYLNLGFNHFSGNIPPQIGLLANIRVLNMHRNMMSGSIPQGIGKLRYLDHLDLGSNSLTGSIPDSFAILNNLEIMDLSCNDLRGKIPMRLGLLQSVEKLNLSHNNLTGPVPSSFQFCFSLTSIDISFNQLEGSFPNIPASLNVDSSFVSNNSGLCGDILGLKPCHSNTLIGGGPREKSRAKLIIFACMIGIVVAAVVFLGSFLFVKKVWNQKEIGDFTTPSPNSRTPLIGCKDILEATKGFSPKSCIAVGRSGMVYKAEMPDGQVFAVKQFNATKDGWGDEGWRRKSLISIAQILHNDLRHRNIVKSHGFCVGHQSCRYLIFELLQTRSLCGILSDDEQSQNFGWSARIQVLQWVAEALFYMHNYSYSPIVHRNVESKNILFDHENVARLCGFGKASLVIDSKSPSDDIFKSDVYSFGKLILEVLMGKPPGDFIALVSSSTNSSFIPVKDLIDHRALPPTYHEEEKLFCASWLAFLCLDHNPQLRPTMHRVCSDLAHLRPKRKFISSTVTISQLIDRNFFIPSRDSINTFSLGQKSRALNIFLDPFSYS